MSYSVKATEAEKPKSKESQRAALLLAAILLIMLVAQLFSYDHFPALIASLWFPGGEQSAQFLAAFIVVAELFALPFLIRMKVSIGFRVMSMLMGWIAVAIWIKIALWAMLATNRSSNIGLLGDTISIAPGWGIVCVSIALGVLTVWASWGLWPIQRRK